MVWYMGSYERYCDGLIGWIWAGGFGVLLVDFVLRLVGDLCDFVYVNWMMYYMILQGDFGIIFKNIGVNFEMLVEKNLIVADFTFQKWLKVINTPYNIIVQNN